MSEETNIPTGPLEGEEVQVAAAEDIAAAAEDLEAAAEITAQQMIDIDDSALTPEQRKIRNEWRDAILVQVISEGIKKQFQELLFDIQRGKVRKSNRVHGYMQALNDVYTHLQNIIPEDYKEGFAKFTQKDAAEVFGKIDDAIEKTATEIEEKLANETQTDTDLSADSDTVPSES